MGRRSIKEIVDRKYIRCPRCKGEIFLKVENHRRALKCEQCLINYPVKNDIPLMIESSQDKIKNNIQSFWESLYKVAYKEHDELLTHKKFIYLLNRLIELFEHREHLAVTEMPVNDLKGKKVLEIGSGAGAHSALFSQMGAHMFSMDITLDRVLATAEKLDMIHDNPKNVCLQGDAESLPFSDNFFEIVYSNGVLHHTPRIDKAIEEVYRVLRPGGMAVIMLYAKHSFYYWVVMFLLKGVLMGNLFKYKNWLGRVTEWMSEAQQIKYNP